MGSAVVAGYNIGVINAPAEYIKTWLNETLLNNYGLDLSDNQVEFLLSIVVSVFLIGGAIGSMFGNYVASRIGRYKIF